MMYTTDDKIDFYLNIYTPIFEHVFTSNYNSGYFGNVCLDMVKQQQWDWFCFFVEQIIEGQTDNVIEILSRRDNSKLTREYFSLIIGKNIVNQVRDIIIETVSDHIEA